MFVLLLVLLVLPHQTSACCCCDCCCCDNNAGLGALGMLGALGALCPPGLLGAGGLGGAAGIGLGLNGGLGLGQTIPGINVPPVVGRRRKRLANILQESISQVKNDLANAQHRPAPKLRACSPRNEPSNFNDPKSKRGKRCQCSANKPVAWR
uniref:Uncharacterized protein n=1 Tax=Ditylenchus dipsaci TaxID=166011 RepID=A0A915D6J0_9BILA